MVSCTVAFKRAPNGTSGLSVAVMVTGALTVFTTGSFQHAVAMVARISQNNQSLHLGRSTVKAAGGTMKTVVALLLFCLCHRGQTDCQADCLSCSNILPKQLSFNTMVCLSECEANLSPAFYQDLCRKVLSSTLSSIGGAMPKRSEEEVEALFPEEDEQMEGGLQLPMAVQRFDHMARALGVDERALGVKGTQLNTAYNSQNALSMEDEYEEEAGQEEGGADMAERGKGDLGLSLSKRFGGFVKGRHGYRKLISPGRSYQKRYGGFIGIRKSARKWNNQKRFSEFLKQYLGMSTRATEFNSLSEDLTQQNQV